MKKQLILSFSIFLCVSKLVSAQQGLQVGLLLQPSLQTVRPAWLSNSGNDFDPDFNQTIRASIGACIDYHLNPYIGVGVNLEYSAQGQKFLATDNNSEYKPHFYKFNFIKVPLFLSYNTSGKVRLIGHVGPQLLVLASAKDKYDGKDHDITDNYAPLNLGFNFGIGLGFMIGRNAMFTAAPNFDILFMNYNYTTVAAEPAYLGKSPVTSTLGIQFTIRYVKNEVASEPAAIK